MGKRTKKIGTASSSEDWRRCRVEASVISTQHGYSKALGSGALVNLDETVCPGERLRDHVKDEWFDPPERKEEKTEPGPEPRINEESDDGAKHWP